LHTGQRQGDLLRVTWGNWDGSFISLRQSKSRRNGNPGRTVEIPATKALRRMLDGLDRSSTLILTTKTGRPWKPRYFKAQWEAASEAAGVTELHFHDLRGTAVTMLAEAGCTTPADRGDHRTLAQDRDEDPRQIPRPRPRSRWRGGDPVRERKGIRVCKLAANQSTQDFERID
jgi:integrase